MTQSTFTVSWKEDICAQISESASQNQYEEYLETLDLSESINKNTGLLSQWQEEFCKELKDIGPILAEELYGQL